jgi:hypothetical protein
MFPGPEAIFFKMLTKKMTNFVDSIVLKTQYSNIIKDTNRDLFVW